MAKQPRLTKRQLAVLDELFTGESSEQAVLDRHNVKPGRYYTWLTNERFVAQLEQHIAAAHRQGELTLARYAPLAAAKLVALTDSENQETARKACLDIISLCDQPGRSNPQPKVAEGPPTIQLSEETAAKLLAILAEQGDVEADPAS